MRESKRGGGKLESTSEGLPEDLRRLLDFMHLDDRAVHDQVAGVKETLQRALQDTEAAVQLTAHAELKTTALSEQIKKLREDTQASLRIIAAPAMGVRPLLGMLNIAYVSLRAFCLSPDADDRRKVTQIYAEGMKEFFETFDEMCSQPSIPEQVEVADRLRVIPAQVMEKFDDYLTTMAARQ